MEDAAAAAAGDEFDMADDVAPADESVWLESSSNGKSASADHHVSPKSVLLVPTCEAPWPAASLGLVPTAGVELGSVSSGAGTGMGISASTDLRYDRQK